MRKLLSAFLAFAVIISITACNNEIGINSELPDPSINSTTTSSSSASSAPKSSSTTSSTSTSSSTISSTTTSSSSTSVPEVTEQGSKILVAYFSRVGNTNWESGVDAVTSASLNVENGDFVGNAEYLAKFAQ